jgi:hypothetical protein
MRVAVHDGDGQSGGYMEFAGDGLRDDDGAMAPPGAADRDRQVALPLPLISGKDVFEKRASASQEVLRFGSRKYVGDHGFVESREGSKFRNEEWIVEKPHIENDVGIYGHPILESERNDARRHPASTAGSGTKMGDEDAPQVMNAHVRGIDDAGGTRTQGRQSFTLDANAVEHGKGSLSTALSRQRVRPSALAEPSQERLITGVEKEHLNVAMAVRFQKLQDVLGLAEKLANSHVDAERDACHPAALAQRNRFRGKKRRQIVDAEKAKIFERVQRL